MTKRSRFIFFIVAILCLFAILLSVCWFVPTLKYYVFGVPIKSDRIFPQPDQMKGYAWGQEVILTEEQQRIVHSLLSCLEEQVWCRIESLNETLNEKSVPNEVLAYKNAEYCLELSYRYPHRYAGLAVCGESSVSYEYERIFLVIGGNEIKMSAFADGRYTGIGGEWVALALEGDLYEFRESVKDVLAEDALSPLKVRRGRVSPLVKETQNFWESPDEMVFAQNGQAVLLSAEERQMIYGAFECMRTLQEGLPRYGEKPKEFYSQEALYKDVAENPCLEFRFCERRRIVAPFAQQKESLSAEEILPEYFDSPFEYDAVLLVMGETGMKVVICMDGVYTGLYNSHWWLDFGPGYADFRAEVLALVA